MKRALKHLPLNAWPAQDRKAFAALFERGEDLFADNGPLSHVSPATQRTFTHSYRRWLGYVTKHHPELLDAPPWDRVTPTTVKTFGRHLRETCNPHTVADQIGNRTNAFAHLLQKTTGSGWHSSARDYTSRRADDLQSHIYLSPPPRRLIAAFGSWMKHGRYCAQKAKSARTP